jgi:hypothetical protein
MPGFPLRLVSAPSDGRECGMRCSPRRPRGLPVDQAAHQRVPKTDRCHVGFEQADRLGDVQRPGIQAEFGHCVEQRFGGADVAGRDDQQRGPGGSWETSKNAAQGVVDGTPRGEVVQWLSTRELFRAQPSGELHQRERIAPGGHGQLPRDPGADCGFGRHPDELFAVGPR